MKSLLKRSWLGALALGAVLLASSAPAGVNRWTPYGPGGGTIAAFALDPEVPSTVYMARQNGGIFKSVDGGLTWVRASAGLGREGIRVIAGRGPSLFAFDARGRLFRSDNHGLTWERIYDGDVFASIPPDPIEQRETFEGAELLLGTGFSPAVYLKLRAGVYRGTDQGRSWELVLDPEREVLALALDPNAPGTLYAGLLAAPGEPALLKSTDGGDTWTPTGEPAGGFPSGVRSITVLPTSPATILVGSTGPGLYRSQDDGATWEKLHTEDPRTDVVVWDLTAEPSAPGTVYAATVMGFRRSNDAGTTWQGTVGPGVLFEAGSFVAGVDPVTGILYGASPHSIERSPNGGRRWRTVLQAGSLAQRLEIDPYDPSIQFVLGEFLFRSRDGGRSWMEISSVSRVFGFSDLAFDPRDRSVIYAAAGGLYRSRDDGEHWELVNAEDTSLLSVGVLDSRTILAGGCGIRRSDDGGATWRRVFRCARPGAEDESGNAVSEFWVDPADPRVVYAEITEYEGRHPVQFYANVYKSQDGGLTWRRILADSRAMALHPRFSQRLYAVKEQGGVLRSDNGGRTWRRVGGLVRFISELRIDPVNPDTLYASTYNEGVFRSIDGGRTWAPINTGLDVRFGQYRVFGLVVHPTLPGQLYIGRDDQIYAARF